MNGGARAARARVRTRGRRWRRTPCAAAAASLLAAHLAGCGGGPPPELPGAAPVDRPVERLALGTLNAKLLPFTGTGARADTIARRILGSGLHVVALQEVFSEAARRDLLEVLGEAYPWSVDRLGSDRLLRSDAGLMLLSRLPFEPLPPPASGRPATVDLRPGRGRSDDAPVRFLEYDRCARADCRAAKGAGYVRLRVAARPLHLFFTHMQAPRGGDPPEGERETAAVRSAQRRELADFIVRTVGPDRIARENVVILGDLNVDGSAELTGGVAPRTAIVGDERARMMEELGAPFPAGLFDLWWTWRPGEPGLTFPVRDLATRFDYVLASLPDPAADLCVTRIERAFGLDPGLHPDSVEIAHEREITDHVGLIAVLATRATGECLEPARP